jgi:hypothetical protein
MQHLTKDILTTKRTKDTKDSEIIFLLRAPFGVAQGMLRDLRGEMSVATSVAA